MDSLSQFALGAAVGVAVMGRRTAAWKAALWGGVLGTLPDLDALIDHGDPVRNMVLHRAETHALFWQTLASAPLAAGITALMAPTGAGASGQGRGRWRDFPRWWLTAWLALVTHALLDAMTVYGTRLALPFSSQPVGLGSIFIIDPLYTLPLLVGLWGALARPWPAGMRWNAVGLALSTAYLAWSALAQHHVTGLVQAQLAARPGEDRIERVLVTPTAFNTLLWRVLVMRQDRYQEGFYSLADQARPVRLTSHPRDQALFEEVAALEAVQRIAFFSRGFFRVDEQQGVVRITDLRMGQEPAYVFSFAVAQRGSPLQPRDLPLSVGGRSDIDLAAGLRWLAARALGQDLEAPGAGQAAGLRLLRCEVAYQPQRRTWPRRVWLRWDGETFAGLEVDGVRPHAVFAEGARLATALDNERIQLDLATLEWASDFRGLAFGRGRCEWTD